MVTLYTLFSSPYTLNFVGDQACSGACFIQIFISLTQADLAQMQVQAGGLIGTLLISAIIAPSRMTGGKRSIVADHWTTG